jgi:hypothetical protein
MALYNNGCLLDFDREQLKKYRTTPREYVMMDAIVQKLSCYLGCSSILDVTRPIEDHSHKILTLKWIKDNIPYTKTLTYAIEDLTLQTSNCKTQEKIEEVIVNFIYQLFIKELQ